MIVMIEPVFGIREYHHVEKRQRKSAEFYAEVKYLRMAAMVDGSNTARALATRCL